MRKPSANHMAFTLPRHFRRLRTTMRLPILSLGVEQEVSFRCWEKQRQIEGKLSRRRAHIELATTDDALTLDYIVSRLMYATNQAGGCVVETIELDVHAMLADLNMGLWAVPQVVDSLRRLTSTLVSLKVIRGKTDRRYPSEFPLLEITKADPETFDVNAPILRITLSDWLADELAKEGVKQTRPEASRLDGIRQRLHGWGLSWVGREHDGGRLIRQAEALARLGPLPAAWTASPWSLIGDVVAANDLPDFETELIRAQGAHAIMIRPRHATPDEPAPSRPEDPLGLTLESDDDIVCDPEPPGLPEPPQTTELWL